MASITFKGNTVHTTGQLPAVGNVFKDFSLVAGDLSKKSLADFQGKLVLNIFPSLDTGVCATSVRKFNEIASQKPGTTVLCISRDLPFAQNRFCGAEGLDKVVTLSDYIEGSFGKDNGLIMTDGPLAGLLSRVVIVLDENRKVVYTEQVPEITQEPDYNAALAAI